MKGIVHFSFAPCFTAAVSDVGTLALGEAPGFLDLLILHVPSFPFQRYSISEKLPHPEPSGCTYSALNVCKPLVLIATHCWLE